MTAVIPKILAKYKDLPLRVIPGYTGGAEVLLAVESGELDAMYNLTSAIPSQTISSGEVIPIVQARPLRPDLPTLDDVMKNKQELAVMRLATAADAIGVPLLAPPGVPDNVLSILRKAYTEMVNSAEYRAAAKMALIDVSHPYSGQGLQKFVSAHLARIAPDTIGEYKAIAGIE